MGCWEAGQTWSFRGSTSRNKVTVGEPAVGSLLMGFYLYIVWTVFCIWWCTCSFWEQSPPTFFNLLKLSLDFLFLIRNNFWQRISWLSQRWRTQRNAIRNVNCRIQWIIESLNAHCALWYSGEHACLSTYKFSIFTDWKWVLSFLRLTLIECLKVGLWPHWGRVIEWGFSQPFLSTWFGRRTVSFS